jgi:ubiquinone/menaquinone biosynthesis C-methylase UbiE
MAGIKDKSQDVVLAYNSLRFAEQPDVWLSEMLRIARPGGTVLFNSEFEQAEEGKPLVCLLDKLNESGFRILRANLMMADAGPDAAPSEWQVMFDLTDNAVLWRVDIPSD